MEKNTKQRLMEAAIELFSTKSYAGTGVDEIAQHIGLKGPNLYKYYKGKDDLLDAIRERAGEEYGKGMGVNAKALESIHTQKEFKAFVIQNVEFTLNNEMAKRMRRIYTIEQYRNEMFAEMATKYQLIDLTTFYEQLFKKLIKEGTMIKGDAKIYALEFVAPTMLMIQLCDRNPEQKEYAMKTVKKHINVFIEKYFTK